MNNQQHWGTGATSGKRNSSSGLHSVGTVSGQPQNQLPGSGGAHSSDPKLQSQPFDYKASLNEFYSSVDVINEPMFQAPQKTGTTPDLDTTSGVLHGKGTTGDPATSPLETEVKSGLPSGSFSSDSLSTKDESSHSTPASAALPDTAMPESEWDAQVASLEAGMAKMEARLSQIEERLKATSEKEEEKSEPAAAAAPDLNKVFSLSDPVSRKTEGAESDSKKAPLTDGAIDWSSSLATATFPFTFSLEEWSSEDRLNSVVAGREREVEKAIKKGDWDGEAKDLWERLGREHRLEPILSSNETAQSEKKMSRSLMYEVLKVKMKSTFGEEIKEYERVKEERLERETKERERAQELVNAWREDRAREQRAREQQLAAQARQQFLRQRNQQNQQDDDYGSSVKPQQEFDQGRYSGGMYKGGVYGGGRFSGGSGAP